MPQGKRVGAIALVLAAVALGSCSPGSVERTSTAPPSTVPAESIQIKDNTQQLTAFSSPFAIGALETLRGFKRAYEAGDQTQLSNVLSLDFGFIRILDEEQAEYVARQAFLQGAGERLEIELSHIKQIPEAKTVSLVAAVGRYSTYFAENDVFTFIFDPSDSSRIKSIVALPIYSDPYPRDAVKVLIVPETDLPKDALASWSTKATSVATANARIEELAEHNVSRIVGDERPYRAIAVFREPLKPGSSVRFEHQFRLKGEWYKPFQHDYEISAPGRFQIIDSTIHSGGPPGTEIAFRIYVNGRLIAEDIRAAH